MWNVEQEMAHSEGVMNERGNCGAGKPPVKK